jgi:hypothetical protein
MPQGWTLHIAASGCSDTASRRARCSAVGRACPAPCEGASGCAVRAARQTTSRRASSGAHLTASEVEALPFICAFRCPIVELFFFCGSRMQCSARAVLATALALKQEAFRATWLLAPDASVVAPHTARLPMSLSTSSRSGDQLSDATATAAYWRCHLLRRRHESCTRQCQEPRVGHVGGVAFLEVAAALSLATAGCIWGDEVLTVFVTLRIL